MRDAIAHVISVLLRSIGLKTLDRQFLFSYVLIFVFAAVSLVSLFLSIGADATGIDMAGAQRMLSQRIAKEALLVADGVTDRSTVEGSIQRFERVHHALMNGDPALKIKAIADESIRTQLTKVEKLWDEYKQTVLEHIKSPTPNTKAAIMSQSTVVLAEMNKAVGMMTKSANDLSKFQQRLSIATTAGILLLVIFGRMFGMKTMMLEIHNLQDHLVMVSKGDYTHRMKALDADNEIGQIIDAYNNMLAQTDEMIREVARVSTRVTADNQKVAVNLTETERGVRQQHSDIDQVATAMNEMVATVQEVARNTTQTATAAEQASQAAENGKQVVSRALDSINGLARQVENAATVMGKLAVDSQEIGSVLEVIRGIAEQTNLLALNAAIEAARAGDQGRGFAVVADEVRTLAQRTQQSTEEIRQIIERLQHQSQEAAQVMTESRTLANAGVEDAASASETLDEIVGAVNTISDMTNQIATAAEEQSKVAEEMDRNIINIADVANRTTQAAQETVTSTEEISAEIARLHTLMARFHTSA